MLYVEIIFVQTVNHCLNYGPFFSCKPVYILALGRNKDTVKIANYSGT